MNTEATFDLLQVEREDIPRLAYIHVVTCMADNAFKLYFDNATEFTARVTDMLNLQVGDPAWRHIKAVDKATGDIAAWASWNTPTDEQVRKRDSDRRQNGFSTFDFPPGLATHVRQGTDDWVADWTAGRRHVLLMALFTDPPYQRRGMGSALVEHGNALADTSVLPILVQASAYGWRIYAQQGFKTVRQLDVDLRKWASKSHDDDKGYGNYRFRYMLRLPKTLPK